MIEIRTFRLSPGADVEAFKEADRRVQAEFAYRQAGLLRRTVAGGDGGTWIVIDLWRSAADADGADERWGGDPAAQAFMAFVDGASVRTARYTELD
ncbi:MAG TPA: hypothetical protein VN799_05740 [Acidimicrobiales bacterium]|nr:hypothetical protein [Acidimicrobiales bacterium]